MSSQLPFSSLWNVLLNRYTLRCQGSSAAGSSSAGAVRRADPRLIELGLRLSISILLSLGISFLASKWLIQFIDPQHKSKQQVCAQKSSNRL
jgi:hypothetical protein